MEAWIEGLKSKKRMNDENWATSLWDLIFFKVKPRPESQQRRELIHANQARTSNIWGITGEATQFPKLEPYT